jgi:hypothetical protein
VQGNITTKWSSEQQQSSVQNVFVEQPAASSRLHSDFKIYDGFRNLSIFLVSGVDNRKMGGGGVYSCGTNLFLLFLFCRSISSDVVRL